MTVCMYRRLGGIIDLSIPNREIGFGFVSCSCRACERAGEAKLRGRVGDVLLNAGGSNGQMCSSGVISPRPPFAAMRMGFKQFV